MRLLSKQSLQGKLTIIFIIIVAFIIGFSTLLYLMSVNAVRNVTYEKMQSQAEYYQQTFETEIDQVLTQQLEIFSDRKLPLLALPNSGMDVYEERDAVLSVREWMQALTNLSNLVDSGVIYLPKSDYYISTARIRKMNEDDRKEIQTLLEKGIGSVQPLQYDGINYYSLRTGSLGGRIVQDPNYVFVITFSSRQVRENLTLLSNAGQGGAFLYEENTDVMLTSGSEKTAAEIWKGLHKDQNGSYEQSQTVSADGKRYLVLLGGKGAMGTFVLYVEEASVLGYLSRFWRYMTLFLVLAAILAVVFILYTRQTVHIPMTKLLKAIDKVKTESLNTPIHHKGNDEFAILYEAFNEREAKIKQLLEEVYVQKGLTQQAQLKQLQAQINPHFLYNTYFMLSRKIKRMDYDGAEEISKHLGNYFKYLTRDGSDSLSLRQEVEHAKSYAAIQQNRFSDRITVQFDDLPEEYAGLIVPRLIIQPLLENSFGHGLENLEHDGLLRLRYTGDTQNLSITVEDNGKDAADETIEKLRERLDDPNVQEVTGLINIHRRLKIYFHGKAGLDIQRSELGGIAVTIFIHDLGSKEQAL